MANAFDNSIVLIGSRSKTADGGGNVTETMTFDESAEVTCQIDPNTQQQKGYRRDNLGENKMHDMIGWFPVTANITEGGQVKVIKTRLGRHEDYSTLGTPILYHVRSVVPQNGEKSHQEVILEKPKKITVEVAA